MARRAVAVVEHPMDLPGPGEALVRVLTAPVCQDDVAIRRGNRPFLRRPPFVPIPTLASRPCRGSEGRWSG